MPRRSAPAIDGFSYLRHLGSGGFSDVFLYHQHLPSRDVAIKVLRSITTEGREQFTTEANLMARVASHSAIATIFAADVDDDGDPYLVMEYCPGGSLGGVYRDRPLDISRVLRLGIRLASALECAHRAGIVHRDIKPANLLITQYSTCVLADFGISTGEIPTASTDRAPTSSSANSTAEIDALSKVSGEEDTCAPSDSHSHPSVGLSLPWAAPEVLAQDPDSDGRADQFSLAATLYTLIEGRSPRESAHGPNSGEHIRARISSGFIASMSAAGVPEGLEKTLRKAMSFDPDARFFNCLEFARALQRIQDELGQEMTATEVPGASLYPSDGMRRGPAPAAVRPSARANDGRSGRSGQEHFGRFEQTWLPDQDSPTAGPAEVDIAAEVAERAAPAEGLPPAEAVLPAEATGTAQNAHAEARKGDPAETVAPGAPIVATGSVEAPVAKEEIEATNEALATPMGAGFVVMAPNTPVAAPAEWRRQISRSGLILAIIFIVVATIGGSLGLIHLYRNPHYSGQEISHLQVERTPANAYSVQAPRGLRPPANLQTRVLAAGDGELLPETEVAPVSLDHATWPEDGAQILNPWILQSDGDELYVSIKTLRQELHLDPSVQLRRGSVLLIAAPEAYFANRVSSLKVSQTDQTIAIVVILS